MQLNPVIEKFYLEALDYSGLKLEDNIIKNKSEKLGDITVDGKSITLPYFNNLKNPEGKTFFHLLNENYTNPENVVFEFYKKRLVLELNIKLSYLIVGIIYVAADVQLQQKIKSSKLINLISNVGEVDHVLTENFLNAIKASKKVNSESFLFDIYLKKNGEINDVPYSAIGKVNFIMANEVSKALDEKDRDYKVFGHKLRKKDLLALNNIFNIVFTDYANKEKYSEGTDNKVFRYLNVLLKTSYIVSARINELCDLLDDLKEPTLNIDDCRTNLKWVEYLKDLQTMATEIRLIPSQVDISSEGHKLKLDETKTAMAEISNSFNNQEFSPTNIQQHQQAIQTPPQQFQQPPVQQRQLSAEDIIKGGINSFQQTNQYQPMMQQMQQPQMFTPTWVAQENNINNPNMNPYMAPMQGNMNPYMAPMQGNMNPYMAPMQGNMNPYMAPMQDNMNPYMSPVQQPGIKYNPMFQNRNNF